MLEIDNIYLIDKNSSFYYKVKNYVISKTSNPYLKTFVLGDTSLISKNVTKAYRNLGISHLFAISGMHITLLSSILLKILGRLKLKEKLKYFVVGILLVFYLVLVGFSASILRAVLFFIFFSINKIYYFYVKPTNIFITVLFISIIINPNYIYDVGFLYSFSISFSLIVLGSYINKCHNYFLKLLMTSLISFIVSIPITIYNFNQLNILSIIYNLFYVPFISIIVFPFSLLTFFIPILEDVLNLLIKLLEISTLTLDKINFSKFVFCNINFILLIIYYAFIVMFFIGMVQKKYAFMPFLIALVIFHYFYPIVSNKNYFVMLDVGQGDSILLHSKGKNILIDTGGIMSYDNRKWSKQKNKYSIVDSVTIPYLKKLGIGRIDYLILTHGDFDHMGEAINLVNNFKIKNVIFNCGRYNYLERQLIDVLEEKKMDYYSCVKNLDIEDFNLQFLNTKIYDNENDNSNVIYFNYNSYKILLMGDAGEKRELDILESYNIKDIDFLKVGHHGSNTSSSKIFINSINPKYSLISVGKNNKFGHPRRSVLNILKNSTIYRTDEDGSIKIILNKNEYEIRTNS